MTPPPDEPSSARLDQLFSLTVEGRAALVADISARGFEPGCWIEVDESQLISSPVEIQEAITRAEALDSIAIGDIGEFDGEHPWAPPEPGPRNWIVLSQSCDLLRDIREEPLVQLALIRGPADHNQLANWARNSSRLIPLDPTGKDSQLFVDLRVQAFVPKHGLGEHELRQAIPRDEERGRQRPRTRFALRVGQRYSRTGIPTPIVERLIKPMAAVIKGKNARRAACDAAFSEWLLVPSAGESFALWAVTPAETESETFRNAEDLFETELLDEIAGAVAYPFDADGSKVISQAELLLADWLTAFKVDLDSITFGGKGPPDSPAPQA